jgi:hypothetical protein
MFSAENVREGDSVAVSFIVAVTSKPTPGQLGFWGRDKHGEARYVRYREVIEVTQVLPTKPGAVICNEFFVAVLLSNGMWSGNFGDTPTKPRATAALMGRFQVLKEEA